MPNRLLSFFLATTLLVPLSARAQLTDPATGTHFEGTQTVDGVTYKCLGVGVRKVYVFVKVYAAVFCVQGDGFPASARTYAAGKTADALADDPDFFKAVVEGSSGKLIVMKLVHDIGAAKMAAAFREKLGQVLPPDKVQRLIDTIPGDSKEGEQVNIYSANGRLTIDIAGNKKVIDDPEIAQKIWYAWLGPDGASPTLKRSIAEHANGG